MSEATLITSVSLLLSVIGFVVLSRLWASFMTDETRDHLFRIRDELFLHALDHGQIDTPAYRTLRTLINGLIRYTHRMTLFSFATQLIANRALHVPSKESASITEWRKSVASLANGKFYESAHTLVILLALRHVLCRSLIGAAIWFVLGNIGRKDKSARIRAIADKTHTTAVIENDALAAAV